MSDFTRQCKFTLPNLVELILNFSNHSLQTEINHFFQIKNESKVPRHVVTDGAFCKARNKFSASAFTELLQVATRSFYDDAKIQTWYGLRILAIDGSKYTLPNLPAMRQAFGGQSNQCETLKPMALVSCLYDVYQGLVLDAKLAHYTSSERDLAFQHLEHTDDNDLVLYDRGYSAFWLVLAHTVFKREFCMRIRRNFNKQTEAFEKSTQKQTVIMLEPTQDMIEKAEGKGLIIEPVRVRLLKVKTKKGVYLLMTSLLDNKQHPMKDFADLYHLRWQIEEGYKKQKCFIEIENFSGKSVLSIKQDFHAGVLKQTLTAITSYYSQGFVKKGIYQRQYAYKINFAKSVACMNDTFVKLLSDQLGLLDIRQWMQTISKNLSIIRPGRSFERKNMRCRRQMLRNGYRYN